VFNLTR